MTREVYLNNKKSDHIPTETNVLNLIKRNKYEEKQEKKKSIILTAAAVSFLALSGLILVL